ncbi:MAG: aminotransferase class V-fold PLP-dependent enzyme [Candidatus Limivivens sp.]|nr:aminotransferase class V-fold PLP-dependent enzyme [Candidatus Limivivens sp.]
MNFYEKIGIQPLINASETYTNLGGSLMDPRTIRAMEEAGQGFVDFPRLLELVCERAAQLTHNEAAFVTTGAAGGVILSAAACICGPDESRLDQLPHVEQFEKNEILMFDGKFREIIPYWKLAGLTGARIVPVAPSAEAMLQAVNERTAAVFLFPATLYEEGIPTCEQVIPALKEKGVTVVVDAAAQLPPRSNLWYYTKELGADLAIFSGGKHIKGPQSTGLIVGRGDLIEACKMAASPNPRIGRAFKTGKEELAGFLTALEIFVEEEPEDGFARQEKILRRMEELLKANTSLKTEFRREGRLGTYQPLLLVTLPEGKTAQACNQFTRAYNPPIDVGVYPPEFRMPENVIFLNAYNLKPEEGEIVAQAVLDYLKTE